MSDQKKEPREEKAPSTLTALLKEKPKRGRPPRSVSRKNVYVALSKEHKEVMSQLSRELPGWLSRSDLPDLAITILYARMEALRKAVADRDREIPEGITDLESLYLLWDLPLPEKNNNEKWTSIRVSPQQSIELGRVHGTLKVLFGTNRSQAFALGLALLSQYLHTNDIGELENIDSLTQLQQYIRNNIL
ncbi:MAG: hypothetical protein Kow0080_33130 [Candidatus Promineifilaceae bacterium]